MSHSLKGAAKPCAAILFAVLFVYAPRAVAQSASPAVQETEITRPNTSRETEARCGAPVEGSWLFTVNQLNSSATYFNAIASFASGGVFLATGSKDRLNPASPLYGTWSCIGRYRYNSTTYFFIFDPAHPDTEAIATLKADQVFELKDRDNLVGAGTVSICDLTGKNCTGLPNSDTQIRGSRIVTENPGRLLRELPAY